mgnify:CR=1 FL=1
MKVKRRIYLSPNLLLSIAAGLMLALSACGGNASAGVKDGAIEIAQAKLDFGENQVLDSSQSTLTVVKLDDAEKLDGLSSDLFELYLDMTCDYPVTINIPLTNTETPEDETARPMLGMGTEIVLADGSRNTLYSYIPAEVVDGMVTASFVPSQYLEQLSVNGASGSAKPSKERLRLGIFWCSTTLTDGGHFLVNFPAQAWTTFIDYNDRRLLLDDLEAVYNDYLAKGYAYAKRSEWPMTVNIQSLDAMGYYSHGWDSAGGKISLNRNLFEGGYKAGSVKPLLAHEFFHFVQGNYIETGSDLLWFDEATATYFEGQAGGNTPSIVAEYKEKIFSGVFPEDNSAANGYARMPLIKFLADRLGEPFILNAYTIAGSGADWESALLSSTGPPAGWAADFYEALVKGDVGDYSPYTLHSNLAGGDLAEAGTSLALDIPPADEVVAMLGNDEIPLLGSTTLNIGPYGAQLVALTIDAENLDRLTDKNDPAVSVDGGNLKVFAIRGKEVTVLSGGVLKDFKKLAKDKTVFLALVTGLHDSGKKDYTLKVEFVPYPTLDELVGQYPDGSLFFSKVYVAAELLQEEAGSSSDDDEAGCDIDIYRAILSWEGQTLPYPLVIAKTGEDSGTLSWIDEEGEESDPLPFTYTNGQLIFDYSAEGAHLTGYLQAAYGQNVDVVINGGLNMSGEGGDVSIDIEFNGSKPLETV